MTIHIAFSWSWWAFAAGAFVGAPAGAVLFIVGYAASHPMAWNYP